MKPLNQSSYHADLKRDDGVILPVDPVENYGPNVMEINPATHVYVAKGSASMTARFVESVNHPVKGFGSLGSIHQIENLQNLRLVKKDVSNRKCRRLLN